MKSGNHIGSVSHGDIIQYGSEFEADIKAGKSVKVEEGNSINGQNIEVREESSV